MTGAALIAAIRRAGVELVPDGDRILLRPPGKLSDRLREQLRAAKPAVLRLLAGEAAKPGDDGAEQTAAHPSFGGSPPCAECGSTSWTAAIVAPDGSRTCGTCRIGLTAMRARGVAI